LPELLKLALSSDPAIASAQAQVRAAEQRANQAMSAFGPTAAIIASRSDSRYREVPSLDLRTFRANQQALQINQPVIRPALVPALDAAQSQLQQALAALSQAQSESALRLLESAFEVLKSRDTLAHARAQQVAAAEQLQAARRAFEVGTVPVTDVRESEAKADAVAAQVFAADSDLGLRQQVLTELTGLAATAWLGRALDGTQLPALPPGSLLVWLADAASFNPQIAQARQSVETADAEVRKARLGHAPTADLTYSFTQSNDNGTVTSVFPRRGDIAALNFNLTIPLFASGATQFKVKEALALRDKAQADWDGARRNVALAVRQSFANALAAIGQARGLEAAVKSQELSLRANRRGYQVGMKVNADVLEAQTKLFETQRDLSRARYDAWTTFLKLKAQSGQLTQEDIEALDAALVVRPTPEIFVPQRTGRDTKP